MRSNWKQSKKLYLLVDNESFKTTPITLFVPKKGTLTSTFWKFGCEQPPFVAPLRANLKVINISWKLGCGHWIRLWDEMDLGWDLPLLNVAVGPRLCNLRPYGSGQALRWHGQDTGRISLCSSTGFLSLWLAARLVACKTSLFYTLSRLGKFELYMWL